MKKTIQLLLFTFFCWQVSFANNTSQEKIDLTPKIKKGDSWNMVFNIGHKNLDFGIELSTSKSSYYMNDGYWKTDWLVECIDSSKDKLILKFSLDRIVHYSPKNEKKSQELTYNDTDYPLNLSNETLSKTKQILGKSIVCEIPWHTNNDVKTLKNEFSDQTLGFPTKTFLDKNVSRNVSINYSSKSQNYTLPKAITHILKLWQISVPETPIAIGENWEAEFGKEEEEVRTKINLQLKSYDENSARIEINANNEKNNIIINRKNGSPIMIDYLTNFKTYSYNSVSSNTNITGNYKNTKLNGEAIFNIEFPINQEKLKVEVQNGKFKMPLDLKNPVYGTLTFNDYKTELFLRPGMKINIDWDNQTAKASGFGAQDVNSIFQFQAIPFYHGYYKLNDSKQNIIEETKSYQNSVRKIIDQYKGSISADCESFINTESNYRIASWYLSSLTYIQQKKYLSTKKAYDLDKANEIIKFFLSHLDSLQPHGLTDPCSPSYHKFIVSFLKLKQSTFLYERGRRYNEDNFKENILFAGMQYVGYPYYYSVYKLLESEIFKGNQSIIKDELNDFNLLPGNTTFSNALAHEIQEMEYIKNGNQFPFSEITDIDGKKWTIPKNEFSIIDIATIFSGCTSKTLEKEEITRILKSKDGINKINYIIIRPQYAKGGIKETTSSDTVHFKYIYPSKKDSEYFSKFKLLNNRRTILLNKNLQILNNNVGSIKRNQGDKLPQILDDYFDTLNQPISKADNSRLWLIVLSSIIGFGGLSLLVIRIRSRQIAKREETRRKIIELELKAIRSQMNPHFIFNALGSIQNLINHNNIKKANLYLSRFARLMRMVLNNSNKQLITLAHELDLLKHYLELEQLRVNFQFNISLADNIDPETEEIPGMLIQPYVENAVIHGITPIGEGEVNINFTKNKGVLQCEITDDGVGINTSINSNGNGLAMKLSEDRLNLLNSQMNTQVRLKVENRSEIEQTKGTKISLTIPVE